MYGLIGKMSATPGDRDKLCAILTESVGEMPGCISYVIAHDPEDENAIWITEVWDSSESHRASLEIDAVMDAIERARPMIASLDQHKETRPVGGHGI